MDRAVFEEDDAEDRLPPLPLAGLVVMLFIIGKAVSNKFCTTEIVSLPYGFVEDE